MKSGFGFLEFDCTADAAECLRGINGESLKGNELQAQEAQNGRKSARDMRTRDNRGGGFRRDSRRR